MKQPDIMRWLLLHLDERPHWFCLASFLLGVLIGSI